jgi:hypothetical protein
MTAQEINAFIEGNDWTFAKTMPNNPHSYLVKSRCTDQQAFEDFVLHIRQHGYRLKFKKNWYVCLDVGEHRYWSMGAPIEKTIIINRAINLP